MNRNPQAADTDSGIKEINRMLAAEAHRRYGVGACEDNGELMLMLQREYVGAVLNAQKAEDCYPKNVRPWLPECRKIPVPRGTFVSRQDFHRCRMKCPHGPALVYAQLAYQYGRQKEKWMEASSPETSEPRWVWSDKSMKKPENLRRFLGLNGC